MSMELCPWNSVPEVLGHFKTTQILRFVKKSTEMVELCLYQKKNQKKNQSQEKMHLVCLLTNKYLTLEYTYYRQNRDYVM